MAQISTSDQGAAASVVKFLQSKGLSAGAAAGIAGNICAESHFNAAAYNPMDRNGPSGGICQWHDKGGSGRLTDLKNFANKCGKPWDSLETQCNFLWHELTTKFPKLYAKLKNTTDAATASYHWGHDFEVFAGYDNKNGSEHTKRASFATAILSGILSGNWQAADLSSFDIAGGAGTGGGVFYGATFRYDVPRSKQLDHILLTELASVTVNLIKDSIESDGYVFIEDNQNIIEIADIDDVVKYKYIPGRTLERLNPKVNWLNNSMIHTVRYGKTFHEKFDPINTNKLVNSINFYNNTSVKYNEAITIIDSQVKSPSDGFLTPSEVIAANVESIFPKSLFEPGGFGGDFDFSNFSLPEFTDGSANETSEQGVARKIYNGFIKAGCSPLWGIAILCQCQGQSGMDPYYGMVDSNGHGGKCYGGGIGAFLCAGNTGGGGAGDGLCKAALGAKGTEEINKRNAKIKAVYPNASICQPLYCSFKSKPKDIDMKFPVSLDTQIQYLIETCKANPELKKPENNTHPSVVVRAMHIKSNRNRVLNADGSFKPGYENGDPRWDQHKGKVLGYLGISESQLQPASTGGIIVGNSKGGGSAYLKSIFGGDVPTHAGCSGIQKGQKVSIPTWMTAQFTDINVFGKNHKVHKSAAPKFAAVWADIQRLRLPYSIVSAGAQCSRVVNNGKFSENMKLSNHTYGLAIDINVDTNPFKHGQKAPASGQPTNTSAMRSFDHPVVQAFLRHGFGWGGAYGDYMHFSIPNGG